MSDWIEWHGGECPVDRDAEVEAELRGGKINKSNAGNYRWYFSEFLGELDIVKYRVIEESKPEVKTLRDEFAMAALTGLLNQYSVKYLHQDSVKEAYLIADMMMKERAK